MRIVHITENPIAGAPWNLNYALNKYGNVESRLIAANHSNGNRKFPHDLIIDDTSYEDLRSVIEGADIIHMHNFYDKQHLFRKYPDLWPLVLSKPRVWQAHTQRDCKWVSFEDALADKSMKHLVIAQYHPRQYPECKIVPNIIDIWDPKYMPIQNDNKIPHIVYSPSNQNLSGWDDKGYTETAPVLKRLPFSHDIIVDVPHEECMLRKSMGDIGIDEVKTGSYHLCSLENLSLGLATVAYLDDLTISYVKEVTGAAQLPWINTPVGKLEEHLLIAAENLQVKKYSRKWMEKYWAPEKLVHNFLDVYKSL